MSIAAAQLTAEIKIVGGTEAKNTLTEIGKATDQAGEKAKQTQNVFRGFLDSQLVMNVVSQGWNFLKTQIAGVFEESEQGQQSMNQTIAVLKSTHDASGETANAVADLATQYSHLTMFSDDTVQAGENMLLTFTNIGKNVFPLATKTVLDMSQALGQDTKNSAIQLGKALNDPITGITALQRVGVTFTDDQKKLIKSLVDTGNTAGAQKVILQELQREFGGSAEAAGKTFPGQLAILQQSLADIKQNIGDALMPVLRGLTSWVTANALPVIGRFSDWFTTTAVPAIQQFATFVTGTVVPGIQNLIGRFQDAGTWIKNFTGGVDAAKPILAGLGAMVLTVLVPAFWSWAAATIAATWPILAIGAAVAGVVAIFMHFYNTNAGFRSFIDGMLNGLRQFAGFIAANFMPAIHQIGDFLHTYILPVLQEIGSFIAGQFSQVWQSLVQLWNGQLMPLFKQLWSALQQLEPLFKIIAVVVGGALALAFASLVGIIHGVVAAVATVLHDIGSLIGGLVQFVTGFVQFFAGIFNFIKDLVTGNFKNLGNDLKGIWQGILNIFGGAFQAMGSVVHAIFGGIGSFISGFVQGVVNTIGNLLGAADKAKIQAEQKEAEMHLHSITTAIQTTAKVLAVEEQKRQGILKELEQTKDPKKRAELEMQLNAITNKENETKKVLEKEEEKKKGILKHLADLKAQADEANKNIVQQALDHMGQWKDGAIKFLGQMKDGALQKLGDFKNMVGGWFSSFGGYWHDRWTDITNAVGNIFSGIGGFIHSALNSAIDIVNGWIRALDSLGVDVGPIHIHPNIPQIPHFQSGIENFQGGLAYVHKDELLVNMPAGTSVVPASRSGAGGGAPITLQVEVYLDKQRMAHTLMPGIVNEIRYATGARF